MPEPSTPALPYGIAPATLDLVLAHAAEALRSKFTDLTDEWEQRDKAGEANASFEELCKTASEVGLASAVDVLNRLPSGVGIITPYRQFNRASTFDPAVTVTINPLDGVERLRHILVTHDENRAGVTANFAVCIGDEVVTAGVIDMYSALLSRVRMNDNRLVTSSDPNGLECEEITPIDSAESLAAGSLLLHEDPGDHGTLLRILGQEFNEPGVVGACSNSVSSMAAGLLDVAWGPMAAFALPGVNVVEPWDEWPLLGLARAASIRLLRATAGSALQELPLQPATSASKGILRLYGQIFVADRYMGELAEHVQVRQLT